MGYTALADRIDTVSGHVQKLRWRTRLRTGFDPRTVSIPKRFLEVETWRGRSGGAFLEALKNAYSAAIWELARDEEEPR